MQNEKAFNIEVQGKLPEWVKNFITYDSETHLFTSWDETQAGALGTHESWNEAALHLIKYAETIDPPDSYWMPIVVMGDPALNVPSDRFVLIKGDAGMASKETYVIKAKYRSDTQQWVTVQNDAVSDEFTVPPTYWMEVPE